ncbi:MAG: type II toxin-antitoxin system VapC family toxin [Bacteroidia bacterium]|nr:type II toxin-antitoxin system VapC family toxin [Bacteroidia bacterium]
MRLLLDTHTFLWYYSGAPELSDHAKSCLDDPQNEFWVSIVSLWEIAIKNSIGKLDLDTSFDTFCKDVVEKGFTFLPVDMAHIMKLAQLPFHHRDPFDRIIITQAIAENMDFVTIDAMVESYLEDEVIKKIW